MKTVQLGTTAEHVSAICLGTMLFGSTLDMETSFAILDAYLSADGTFLDTANIYAGWIDGFDGGESETVIGNWMQSRNCRHKMFVATKVGGILHRGHEHLHEDQPRLTAQQIITECEKSLQRLQCDTIDLYYAHVDDRLTPLEETLKAFQHLITSGKVRYIGASNIAAWRLAQANLLAELHSFTPFVCVQQKYTYLHPRIGATFAPQVAVSDELVDYCKSTAISLLAYSPLIGGVYGSQNVRSILSQFQSRHLAIQLKTLSDIAQIHQTTENQIVLAWMYQHKLPIVPVIGVDSVEQLKENINALSIDLSDDQIYKLDMARINRI